MQLMPVTARVSANELATLAATREKHLDDPLLRAGAVHLVVDAVPPPGRAPAGTSRTETPWSVAPADLERTIVALDAQGWQIVAEASHAATVSRVLDAFAAAAKYGAPLIVIDFGTATTFNCVSARGEFIGGAIAPGIATSVDALVNRAARLARVELVRPKEAIGRNTTSNLQSGAIYGYAGLVDGLVDRMRSEMGGTARVIATGGNAGLIVDVARCVERVEPWPAATRSDGHRRRHAWPRR